MDWYLNVLSKKGLYKQGRFVKDHPSYKSNSPVRNRKVLSVAQQLGGYECDECGQVVKSKGGLTQHKKKRH